MSNENLLRKIRALLTQAEDPAATPAEAEAFSAKAQEMMVRYSIDQALVDAEKPGTRETPVLRVFPMEEGYTKPKMYLLAGIAGAFSTNVVRHESGGTATLHIIGFQSDLNLIDTLYTSLLLQGMRALNRERRSDRSFRTSFWYGFAQRASQRAEDTHKRVTEEVTNHEAGTALVLVERKSEVAEFAADHYRGRRLGKVAGPQVRDHSGYARGTEAANRADLGGARISGGHKALA